MDSQWNGMEWNGMEKDEDIHGGGRLFREWISWKKIRNLKMESGMEWNGTWTSGMVGKGRDLEYESLQEDVSLDQS